MAYTDAERTEALITLALNKYNWEQASKETGIPVRTLRRWDKSDAKKTVPELLERTISRLLMKVPWQIPPKDYGIILGILLDKYLLMTGAPTSRSETVLRKLDGLSDDEWDDIQQEMERILAGGNRGGDGSGAGPNHR